MLRRFAEANDLIESNVAGALNANLAFLKAMAEAGGGGTVGGDAEAMLAEVWGQEAAVRAETEAWLFPFLALAYQPLSDSDLEAYVAFSETPEGAVDVGFRARPGFDVSRLALALGGGGHPQASGCTIDGPLVAAQERVVPMLIALAADGPTRSV
jgi:hypothetical protein